MSRRSILLTTAMCMALASTAAINPASAHGGGFGGGSFHTPTRTTLTGQVPAPIYTGSIALSAKGQKIIPASAFAPAAPIIVGPAPTVLKPVGPGVKVNKGAPDPTVPY